MAKKRHKYAAEPQITDDGRFDSKRELKRWGELKLLQTSGEITGLTRDRKSCTFSLHAANGSEVCKYVADFVYVENGKKVAEDSKGFKTDVYRIKRKLFLGCYPNWEHRES
jgi:hypothetical protein